jgi:hypothetical protein
MVSIDTEAKYLVTGMIILISLILWRSIAHKITVKKKKNEMDNL